MPRRRREAPAAGCRVGRGLPAGGKIAATNARSVARAAELIERGYQLLGVGSDLGHVATVAADTLAELRRRGLI